MWELDSYLANVIGGALEYLANHHISHPYDMTGEEWEEQLRYIADCFKQYNDEPDYVCADYLDNAKFYEERTKRIKEGLVLLSEIYSDLWD